jgi:hypothetical protein
MKKSEARATLNVEPGAGSSGVAKIIDLSAPAARTPFLVYNSAYNTQGGLVLLLLCAAAFTSLHFPPLKRKRERPMIYIFYSLDDKLSLKGENQGRLLPLFFIREYIVVWALQPSTPSVAADTFFRGCLIKPIDGIV